MQQQSYGVVYMIKCFATGKPYVGQTTRGIKARWNAHVNYSKNNRNACVALENAIRKYGEESFYRGIICECSSQGELDIMERFFIEKYNSINEGYNIREGGSNGKLSMETKRKISERRIGVPLSIEARRKMSESCTGKKRGPLSDDVKQKISSAHMGKRQSDEHKEKARRKRIGLSRSIETREKMSQAQLGERNHQYGKRRELNSAWLNLPTDEINKMFTSGVTRKQIAKYFGVSFNVIQRRLQEAI